MQFLLCRQNRQSCLPVADKGAMMTLAFKDVSVTLNKKEILSEVCGGVKVGQMLAIMGPSG